MMLGHGLLAFSIIAALALLRGLEKEKALKLGMFAGLFAFLPDVDMILSLKAFLTATSIGNFAGTFWGISLEFHRGLSHSLVTGLFASGLFSIYYWRPKKYVALLALSGLTAYAYFISGLLPAFVMAVFSALGVLFTYYAEGLLDFKEFLTVSLFGLLSHPFGDLFTGTPPDFFYPFSFYIVEARYVLSADPVLNLLLIFSVEVFVVWSAIAVFGEIRDYHIPEFIHSSALIGVLYFPALLFIAPPTLKTPYQFVYSILGIGLINSSIIGYLEGSLDEKTLFSLVVNVTATVTVAFIFFVLGYLVL